MQLETVLASPESLRSIISSDFTLDGINLDDLVYNPEDIKGTRDQVIERLLKGYEATAAAGYAEQHKSGSGSGSGAGSGSNAAHSFQVNFNAEMPIVYNGMKAEYDSTQGGYVVTKLADGAAIPGITDQVFKDVNQLGLAMGKMR
jgi:hypothetical protein